MSDLDSEMAKIMGWHMHTVDPVSWVTEDYQFPDVLNPRWTNEHGSLSFYQDPWQPSTNISQAFRVVEKMRENGFNFNFNWQAHPGITISISQFHKIHPFIHGQGSSDVPAEAICLAAKKAMEAM